jgi:aspartate/methionine/tyrosine aminotransferase
MLSSRLHWDLQPNRIAEAVAAKRAAGGEILDLTESNPTRAEFEYPGEEILAALHDERALVYEAAPAGLQAAREAISSYYAARGLSVEPARILISASTSESYAWLFKLLADAGDNVLVPRPSYPLFEFLAQLEAVCVVSYPLVYHDGWQIDFEALERAVTRETRAIVLVNPNNPTGSFLKRHELDRLITLCAEREIAIVSDEVFADYAFASDPARVSSLTGVNEVLTFCLSGLSKIAGLPQMKLGWIVIGGPAGLRARAAESLELIADTYLSAGTPVQHALPRLLAAGVGVREQISDRLQGNLECLRSMVGTGSCGELLKVEGGWYATLRVPRTRTEEEWCLDLLDRDSTLVQPGFFYDFESEAYLVVSLLTETGRFREGVRRLTARLSPGAG